MKNYEPLEDSDEEVRALAKTKMKSEQRRVILKEDVSCILPTEKNIYLSLTRFLLQEEVEVLFRNKILGLQEDKTNPEELLRKMIDNMCLNALCLVPSGIVAIVSTSPKDHRKTLCCGVNGTVYFYKTSLPFLTQELKKSHELLIGNFDYIIIENLTFTKKQKIRKLPKVYEQYQTELKKPFTGTNNDLFIDFIPHSKFRRYDDVFLTQKEIIIKYNRARPTKRKYLLVGEKLTLAPYVYEPCENQNYLNDFKHLISYDFAIKSLLFLKTDNYSFTSNEDIYIVSLTHNILVNEKDLFENTGIRIAANEKIKISANYMTNICLFTLRNHPSQ